MTSLKLNQTFKNHKPNGNFIPITALSELKLSQFNYDLSRHAKAQEAIHWERIELLEDTFVQAIEKEKSNNYF